jgi:hypothetical protein
VGTEVHVTCDGCGAEAIVGSATQRWTVLLQGGLDHQGLPDTQRDFSVVHLCDQQCRARWHERQARAALARA